MIRNNKNNNSGDAKSLPESLQFREEKRITVIQGGGRVYKDNT